MWLCWPTDGGQLNLIVTKMLFQGCDLSCDLKRFRACFSELQISSSIWFGFITFICDVWKYACGLTLRGSKRCSCSWACRRSRAAATTDSGSSRPEPRRSSPLHLQSRWSTSVPCAWGRTSHLSLRFGCPLVWFSLSETEQNGIHGSDLVLSRGLRREWPWSWMSYFR